MRCLLIEDDPLLRTQLAAQLRAQQIVVDETGEGNEGIYYGNEYPIDIAIVDLGLPDTSGFDVIESWRANARAFPILILTARGRWQDKVKGLEAGADDYLVKPFQFEELLARVRALTRRAAGWTSDTLVCAPVVLNRGRQSLSVAGAPVELTSYEYKVLEHLMMHQERVVSKSELSEHLYADDDDRDSNVLEVLIGRLRRKIDPQRTINPIVTVRGQGYRFRLEKTRPDD